MKPRKAISTGTLADRLIADANIIDVGHIIESAPATWGTLYEQVRRENDGPTEAELQRLEDVIRQGLPEALHKTLMEWSDRHNREVVVNQEAAFTVGLAVGRFIVGGAR